MVTLGDDWHVPEAAKYHGPATCNDSGGAGGGVVVQGACMKNKHHM